MVVASTGVIGQRLNLTPIAEHMDELTAGLSYEGSPNAAQAIMTTDTISKEIAVEFTVDGKTCRMGGIAKGSGMIHPNMATMLVFITTDCAISAEMLQKALSGDVQNTFNMLSIDGDTSTNDMVTVLANGMAGNPEIVSEGEDFDTFMKALNTLNVYLCRAIAGDGEGATKLLECKVSGADDIDSLETERYVSTGRLIAVKNGDQSSLVRFSVGKIGQFDNLTKAFNSFKEKGEAEIPTSAEPEEKKCKKCGKPCPPGKDFCRKCGKNQSDILRKRKS